MKNVPPANVIPEKTLAKWGYKYLWPFFSSGERDAITREAMGVSSLPLKIRGVFLEVYLPDDGLNLRNKTYNGDKTYDTELVPKKEQHIAWQIIEHISINNRVLWTSFFGLPNRIEFDGKSKLTGLQIIKNFLALPDKNPQGFALIALDYLKGLLAGLCRPVIVITTTVWNIGKLFTEFLPATLETLCFYSIAKLIPVCTQTYRSWWEKGLAGIAIFFLTLGFYVSKLWRLSGRIITSPAESMKAAWRAGVDLGDWEVNGYKVPIGKAIGGFLSALSLSITIAVYVIVFPLGIKAAIAHGPAFISTVCNSIVNSSAVQWLSNLTQPLVTALKSARVVAAVLTAFIVPARVVWDFYKEKIRTWLNNKTSNPIDSPPKTVDNPQTNPKKANSNSSIKTNSNSNSSRSTSPLTQVDDEKPTADNVGQFPSPVAHEYKENLTATTTAVTAAADHCNNSNAAANDKDHVVSPRGNLGGGTRHSLPSISTGRRKLAHNRDHCSPDRYDDDFDGQRRSSIDDHLIGYAGADDEDTDDEGAADDHNFSS